MSCREQSGWRFEITLKNCIFSESTSRCCRQWEAVGRERAKGAANIKSFSPELIQYHKASKPKKSGSWGDENMINKTAHTTWETNAAADAVVDEGERRLFLSKNWSKKKIHFVCVRRGALTINLYSIYSRFYSKNSSRRPLSDSIGKPSKKNITNVNFFYSQISFIFPKLPRFWFWWKFWVSESTKSGGN